MTYQEIIRRTAVNLSLTSISTAFVAVAKRDIYDVVNSITRKVQFLKAVNTDTITDASGDLVLQDDFFFPVEVVFFNDDGYQYVSVELQREAFEKWIPNVTVETQSFVNLVTSATPDTYVWTQENEDYDGKVGYLFTETHPVALKWKPLVDGTVKVIYATYDDTVITTVSNSPDIHKVFHELIVVGVTLKLLYRKLLTITQEIELISVRSAIKIYQTDYIDILGDLTAFAEKKVTFEVQRMEQFDFLNDRTMLM